MKRESMKNNNNKPNNEEREPILDFNTKSELRFMKFIAAYNVRNQYDCKWDFDRRSDHGLSLEEKVSAVESDPRVDKKD